MEKRLDKTLRLDMIPPMSRTLYVKNEFVIADNLYLKLPEKIAAMLSEGLHTRTLSPRGLSFPYRIGFNAILFVETGEVDCVLGNKVFHARACSVIMIPSATILMNLTWEAGTRFLMIAYNDGHLISQHLHYNFLNELPQEFRSGGVSTVVCMVGILPTQELPHV